MFPFPLGKEGEGAGLAPTREGRRCLVVMVQRGGGRGGADAGRRLGRGTAHRKSQEDSERNVGSWLEGVRGRTTRKMVCCCRDKG